MQSFLRRAKSLEQLREDVLLAYGPNARIVDATRVTRKGLGRFFANDEVEAIVEVPAPAASPAGGVSAERIDRAGIAALLADVDRVESGGAPARREPSTASPGFAVVLASIERGLGMPSRSQAAATDAATDRSTHEVLALPAGPTPALSTSGTAAPVADPPAPRVAVAPSPGDLVLFVGLAGDALAASRSIAAALTGVGADQCTTGPSPRLVPGGGVVAGRRDALLQRAASVDRGRAVFVAHAAGLDDGFDRLAELRPDEVWAVADASRSLSDTEEWVARLHANLGVHALAVIGTSLTRDPAALGRLGIPIGWSEPETLPRRA